MNVPPTSLDIAPATPAPLPPTAGNGLISTLRFIRDTTSQFESARRRLKTKVFRINGFLLRDVPTIIVSDANEIRRIFEDSAEEFRTGFPPSVAEKFRQGISAQHGAPHRRMRSIVRRPLAGGRAVASQQPMFLKLVEDSLATCAAAKTPFIWRTYLRDLAFSFVARIALGAESEKDVRWLTERWDKVAPTVFFPSDFSQLPWWTAPVRWKLKSIYDEGAQALNEIRTYVEAAAVDRRQNPREDALTAMVRETEEGQSMTMQQIVDTSLEFMFAGHETVKTAFASFLYFVHEHPSWKARLVEEQAALVAKGVPITVEGTRQMPLLLLAIKETLRWTPVTILFRACDHDTTVGGYHVPAGWIIGLDIGGMHFDPDYWPEPHVWNPARFEGENERRDSAYFPFGRGRRSCIGEQPAMMELLTFGATVLRRMAKGLEYTVKPGSRDRWFHPGQHQHNPLIITRFTPGRE